MTDIQSIGLPPERHADRVIASMMRDLAHKRVRIHEAMTEAFLGSSDGSPKAQRKMEERIRRVGVMRTKLKPGKRGRYSLTIYDMIGWDQRRDDMISLEDKLPERPWIACTVWRFTSKGGGANKHELRLHVFLFVTHHVMSRMAQRLGMRTPEHLTDAVTLLGNVAIKLINEKGIDAALAAPPQGWRVPVADGRAVIVLQRHVTREALVAATVIA